MIWYLLIGVILAGDKLVDISQLQSLSYVVAAIGVCVAAFYYVSMLRNAEKIRRRDMVFQKINVNTYQFYDMMYDVARMTDWNTLEEFQRKYSYWVNPEAYKKFIYIMNHYNCLGILLRDGLVDTGQIFQLHSAGWLMRFCETFRPWMDVQGIHDDYFGGLKYLEAEARRLYPDASRFSDTGLMRSLEEVLERDRKRNEVLSVSSK